MVGSFMAALLQFTAEFVKLRIYASEIMLLIVVHCMGVGSAGLHGYGLSWAWVSKMDQWTTLAPIVSAINKNDTLVVCQTRGLWEGDEL